MHEYQGNFIKFAIEAGALRFGDFILKSGRRSPFFFNAGVFGSGCKLMKLGQFYAEALLRSNLAFDMLYGPAYKGIPLACAAAIALCKNHALDKPYAFNRKEAKDHGEGGQTVGAPLQGRVVIVDDVITAGTSVKESVSVIEAGGAKPCGVLIALDRQELTASGQSAIAEIESRYSLPVHAIVTINDVLIFLESRPEFQAQVTSIREYRQQFGSG